MLFRGQPAKTEEEDGQNRKADDEYLIRRGLLQGPIDSNGEFTQMHNIIDAIVVLPGNLFYGTTIPGSVLFINKKKPKHRKDKVLMIYAAKESWYKEKPNMNELQPHDMLRISTILESWGDLAIAQEWIATQKVRLWAFIQEDLGYKLSEIEEHYHEDLQLLTVRAEKAKKAITAKETEEKKPTKSELKHLETLNAALEKMLNQKADKIMAAHEFAAKERKAIDEVELELITMLQDPELRKRYFSVVDMDELEENEYNLNIPRYVDTFEPEEEIDLDEATNEFKAFVNAEAALDHSIVNLLAVIG